MFQNLIDIIAAPNAAFARIREKPTILFPLLLLILALTSAQAAYYLMVDFDFLIEELVAQTSQMVNVPEDQLRQGYANVNPTTLAVQTVISIALGLVLITALYAGYLTLVSKFTNDGIDFRRWYSLQCWTGIPTIFGALATWVVVLSNADGMIAMRDINPLSLNNLLFQTEGPLATLLDNLTVVQIWSLVLLALGYRHWTGKSLATAIVVTWLPMLLIFGGWALIALL